MRACPASRGRGIKLRGSQLVVHLRRRQPVPVVRRSYPCAEAGSRRRRLPTPAPRCARRTSPTAPRPNSDTDSRRISRVASSRLDMADDVGPNGWSVNRRAFGSRSEKLGSNGVAPGASTLSSSAWVYAGTSNDLSIRLPTYGSGSAAPRLRATDWRRRFTTELKTELAHHRPRSVVLHRHRRDAGGCGSPRAIAGIWISQDIIVGPSTD